MREVMNKITTRNILAIMGMLGFFGLVFALLFIPIQLVVDHKDVIMVLILAVTVTLKDIVGFFFGSSKDIEDKNV